VVIVDDDMRVGPGFLQAHLDAHRAGAEVVYGWIATDDDVSGEPLFTRYHQRSIDQALVEYRAGAAPSGARLCTGNVSFRRSGYQAVGGFDLSLVRCEDRDLGIRMEAAGMRFVLADDARSEHRSDHDSLPGWRRRNAVYGRSDVSIARKHPTVAEVSPWAFFDELPAVVRPVLVGAAMVPSVGHVVGSACYAVARRIERRASGPAMTLVGLCYALDYYGGVGQACGGAAAALRSWRNWRAHRGSGTSARASLAQGSS
jgi:hypothetical protein